MKRSSDSSKKRVGMTDRMSSPKSFVGDQVNSYKKRKITLESLLKYLRKPRRLDSRNKRSTGVTFASFSAELQKAANKKGITLEDLLEDLKKIRRGA